MISYYDKCLIDVRLIGKGWFKAEEAELIEQYTVYKNYATDENGNMFLLTWRIKEEYDKHSELFHVLHKNEIKEAKEKGIKIINYLKEQNKYPKEISKIIDTENPFDVEILEDE